MQLIKYNESRQALQECARVDEAKNILDKVEALRAYAHQSGDVEMEQWVAEIKLRARRRIGEISTALEKSKPGVKPVLCPSGGTQLDGKREQLKQAGITSSVANRCEKIAAIPESEFETVIAKAKEDKKPVTYADVEKAVGKESKESQIRKAKEAYINKSVPKENKPEVFLSDAVEFLKDINHRSIDLLITDPPYSTDVDDIQLFAKSWLSVALSKIKNSGRAYICIGAYPKEVYAYLSILLEQDRFIVDNPLVWTYRNTLGQTPKMKYNLNYQLIFHLYTKESRELDTSITNEMFSVQDINAPDGRQGNRLHTWQKPDELANRLIRHSTKPKEVVMDPFCCTGTFLIAASRQGCISYGSDNNKDNLAIAKERGCVLGG